MYTRHTEPSGINLTFRPDGHRMGIFSFDYLRSLQAGV
jgi:DUF971 family protein